MCPEGFVLGPDWKNCDDVDECAAGDDHNHENHNHENHNHNDLSLIMILSLIMASAPLGIVIIQCICMICCIICMICMTSISNDAL